MCAPVRSTTSCSLPIQIRSCFFAKDRVQTKDNTKRRCLAFVGYVIVRVNADCQAVMRRALKTQWSPRRLGLLKRARCINSMCVQQSEVLRVSACRAVKYREGQCACVVHQCEDCATQPRVKGGREIAFLTPLVTQ